jgi:ATP-dependent DNA helicase PIF1
MKLNSPEAAKLKETVLIIIDEASMLSSHSLRIIDTLLREIMNDTRPFGGKTVVLGGDFRQTTNIVPRGSVTDILEVCIKNSPLWQHVKQRSLITNMRTAGQDSFNEWVLKIGNGSLNTSILGVDAEVVHLPNHLVENGDIVRSIYGTVINTETDMEISETSKKVILTPKNEIAMNINLKAIDLLPSEEKTYVSIDNVMSDDVNDVIDYPIEFLNQQCPSGMPPHRLTLKKGAFIMLLRNLNPKQGLLNGTRLVVKALQTNFIDAEIITGSNKGERVFIPRIILQPSESTLPFKMQRRQFPINLAFAMTINKSQGQSFDRVGVYLPEPVFAHGQLYVALTRGRNHKNLKVHIKETFNQGKLMGDQRIFTKNVVIKEILNK